MNGPPPRNQELRKHKRYTVRYPAWIIVEPSQPPRRCMMLNVSQGGAKIEIDEQLEPPEKFTLLLTEARNLTRWCRVVWRNGPNIGIQFLQPPAPARKLAVVPKSS